MPYRVSRSLSSRLPRLGALPPRGTTFLGGIKEPRQSLLMAPRYCRRCNPERPIASSLTLCLNLQCVCCCVTTRDLSRGNAALVIDREGRNTAENSSVASKPFRTSLSGSYCWTVAAGTGKDRCRELQVGLFVASPIPCSGACCSKWWRSRIV
jgi:hypothetical protein